ncbi:hypothetical protein BJX96DRAFT_146599 [Aspergillus floccosus]
MDSWVASSAHFMPKSVPASFFGLSSCHFLASPLVLCVCLSCPSLSSAHLRHSLFSFLSSLFSQKSSGRFRSFLLPLGTPRSLSGLKLVAIKISCRVLVRLSCLHRLSHTLHLQVSSKASAKASP